MKMLLSHCVRPHSRGCLQHFGGVSSTSPKAQTRLHKEGKKLLDKHRMIFYIALLVLEIPICRTFTFIALEKKILTLKGNSDQYPLRWIQTLQLIHL